MLVLAIGQSLNSRTLEQSDRTERKRRKKATETAAVSENEKQCESQRLVSGGRRAGTRVLMSLTTRQRATTLSLSFCFGSPPRQLSFRHGSLSPPPSSVLPRPDYVAGKKKDPAGSCLLAAASGFPCSLGPRPSDLLPGPTADQVQAFFFRQVRFDPTAVWAMGVLLPIRFLLRSSLLRDSIFIPLNRPLSST